MGKVSYGKKTISHDKKCCYEADIRIDRLLIKVPELQYRACKKTARGEYIKNHGHFNIINILK